MRRLALMLAILLAACGEPGGTEPPPSVSAATTPATILTPPPTTSPISSETVDFTVSDCRTPPVTFALLCDVYDLLADYHVDAPLDAAALAAGATLGVESHVETGEEAGPDSFVCAVPDAAFETICSSVADRLQDGRGDIESMIETAVASMITFSLDPFTFYVPPELAGAFTQDGVVTAVGLLLTIENPVGSRCTRVENQCRLQVVFATEGGPAGDVGMGSGDVITSIDGESVEGATLVEVAADLDGDPATLVTIGTATDSGEEVELEVVRAEPVAPELEVSTPRPGVGYVRLPDFEADIPQFLHTALESDLAGGVDHLVLDLRDNPGGYVDVAVLVASEFLADGLVMTSSGPEGDFDYPVQDGGLATSGPAVTVVVNAGSASASEIVAGVLQERSRASVVGEPTFGKDSVQIPFELRNDGQLRVTISRWATPGGGTVAGTGVVPDELLSIPADATPEEVVDLILG